MMRNGPVDVLTSARMMKEMHIFQKDQRHNQVMLTEPLAAPISSL